MKNYLPISAIVLLSLFLTGCDFLGSIFQTGIGVGIFIAVVILILIFFIARMFRKR